MLSYGDVAHDLVAPSEPLADLSSHPEHLGVVIADALGRSHVDDRGAAIVIADEEVGCVLAGALRPVDPHRL